MEQSNGGRKHCTDKPKFACSGFAAFEPSPGNGLQSPVVVWARASDVRRHVACHRT